MLQLSRARFLSVYSAVSAPESSTQPLLACGILSDVYRELTAEGAVTHVLFSPGLPLWQAFVSLSVEAGVSLSETVHRLLAASGTGFSLLAFPEEDPVSLRGHSFFGRAAECVSEALSVLPAEACVTPSGLCVVPASGWPVSLFLSEEDLLSAPSAAAKNLLVLRTAACGWPLGKTVSVTWKGQSAQGILRERFLDLDTGKGPWRSELLLEKC